MQLEAMCKNAARAARMREQCRRTGTSLGGHPLWTKEEDVLLEEVYPDYGAAKKALPRRTMASLKNRVRTLGLPKEIPQWTCVEVSRLRKMYRMNTWPEILAAFPKRTYGAIQKKTQELRLRRPRLGMKPTGHILTDAIILQARRLNITMAELDAMCRTKHYFAYKQWRDPTARRHGALLRAVDALGGEIVQVRWPSLCE